MSKPQRTHSRKPFDDAPRDAVRMVELLSGSPDSLECFHGLKPGGSRCLHGAITDPAVTRRLADWNAGGFDIYVTAHLLYEAVTGNPTNEDIEAGRALFIDSDGADQPEHWHLPPTFTLERDDEPATNWWAFWIIDPAFPADRIAEMQRRLAAMYGTDPSVSDPRRIVRLPGYIRHKANERPGKKNPATADTVYRLTERDD